MPFDEKSIRPATANDSRYIAEVHVAASKATYHAIFPPSVLEVFTVEKREMMWQEILSEPRTDSITLVACDPADVMVGFASGGAERTGNLPCDAELYAIYLLEAVRGQGIGTLLVRRLARDLQSKGFSSMAVWVLALNPYRKFYESLGATVIGEKTIERGGQPFLEIAYGWQDLNTLQREIAS